MSFTNFGGGLINTVVSGAGNNVSTELTNQLSGDVAFSVGNVLAGAVEDSTGYFLNDGSNYFVSQLGSLLPSSEGNDLYNAVLTQVATVGINALTGFVGQGVEDLIGAAAPLTGLGSGTLGRGSISFPMEYVQQLPDAEYAGGSYNLLGDVVFTITPANAGAQTQEPPQTSPTTEWDVGFDPSFSGTTPGIDALKGQTALVGPANGRFGNGLGGRNLGAAYSVSPTTRLSGTSGIKSYW